jgi:inosine/xanthosine triphosphatase
MIIAIGSLNPVKVQAVEETLKEYPGLAHATCVSVSAASEVSDQPMSLEEIIQGAKNRARNAFKETAGCHYAIGLESGLFAAPGTQTGYLESSICCIYNGRQDFIGMSCGFEIPEQILSYVLEKKMDLGQACHASGATQNTKLGSAEGLIGILSKNRITRKDYTKQSIMTALMQIEQAEIYRANCKNPATRS